MRLASSAAGGGRKSSIHRHSGLSLEEKCFKQAFSGVCLKPRSPFAD